MAELLSVCGREDYRVWRGDQEVNRMRVQLELSEDAVHYLDQLQKDLGASSRAETLRNAMAVLRWTADKVTDGYQVLAVKEDEQVAKELNNPLLEQAAHLAKERKSSLERRAVSVASR